MKVFLSWSGMRSKFVAEHLRSWIPKVLQAVHPWMSDEDIGAGTRWAAVIGRELENTRVGIVCLTNENQLNPWVMFEAGALSKMVTHSSVIPYLIDLSPSQLSGPMAQFQAVVADKEGTARLIHTLNKTLEVSQIPSTDLDEILEVWWPKLEQALQSLPPQSQESTTRSLHEILDEVAANTREQLRREEVRMRAAADSDDRVKSVFARMEALIGGVEAGSESPLMQMVAALKNYEDQYAKSARVHPLMGEHSHIFEKLPQTGQLVDIDSMAKMFLNMREMFDKAIEQRNEILDGGNADEKNASDDKNVDDKPSAQE